MIYVARPAVNSVQLVEQVIEALVRMVSGEFVGYNERELVSHDLRAAAEAPSVARSRDVAGAVTTFCSEYPLSMERHHVDVRALRISDFASPRQLHRLDYYDQALRPLGVEHQIRFWVAAPSGIARFYYVSRRNVNGDFADRGARHAPAFAGRSSSRCTNGSTRTFPSGAGRRPNEPRDVRSSAGLRAGRRTRRSRRCSSCPRTLCESTSSTSTRSSASIHAQRRSRARSLR